MTRKVTPPPDAQSTNNTGSPGLSEPVYLEVGRLRRPHGLQGETLLEVFSYNLGYFEVGKTVYIGKSHQPMVVEFVRPHNQMLLVRFQGITSPEEASYITNSLVYIPMDQLEPLPEGEYYFYQLIGLEGFTEKGEELGVLTEIIQTGAVPVYVVTSQDGTEQLFPAIPEVVKKIDLKANKIVLKPQEWE